MTSKFKKKVKENSEKVKWEVRENEKGVYEVGVCGGVGGRKLGKDSWRRKMERREKRRRRREEKCVAER